MCATCDMIRGLLMAQNVPAPIVNAAMPVIAMTEQVVKKKARKKVSKYQREFGRQLKKLKAKHPRTQVQTLMKRAHRLTKKVLK